MNAAPSANIDKLVKQTKGLTAAKAVEKMATDGVADAEMRATLARQGYGKETIDATIADYNATAAKKANEIATRQLTAEEVKDGLVKAGLTEEEAAALVVKGSVVNTNYAESASTRILTEATVDQAIATGVLTEAEGAHLKAILAKKAAQEGAAATLAATAPLLLAVAAALAVVGAALYAAHKFANQFNEALEKSKESHSAFIDAANELETLQSELDSTKEKIEELESKEGLTLSDEAELEKLREQNDELQRQIDLKENAAEAASNQDLDDAMKALTAGGIEDISTGGTHYSTKFGENVSTSQTGNIVEVSKNEIAALRKLKEERKQLFDDKQKPGADTLGIEKEIEEIDKQIKRYEDTIVQHTGDLNTLRESFLNTDGTVRENLTDEQRNMYETVTEIINDWNNIDLTETEHQLSKIESYFSKSGKNHLKDRIEDIINSTKDSEYGAVDAAEAFEMMGYSLEDAGIEAQYLNRYFDDITKSANEAADAANKFEPPTVEDVLAAFEDENQGANYDAMVEKITEAKELAKKGLYGTNEVQEIAQWVLPQKIDDETFGSGAYIKAWKKAYGKVKNWFNADNPAKGMWNFLDELNSSKKIDFFSEYDKSKGKVKFSEDFESSAQAAKELGVNIDVVETMLHKLEEFGFTFDDDFKFSGEMLSEYETALSGIQEIYESTEDGELKSHLGVVLDKADEEDFTNNIEELTQDRIIEIQLEYDLATLDHEIEKLKSSAASEGYENTEKNASTMGAYEARKSTWESKHKKASKGGYSDVNDSIIGLQRSMIGEKDESKRSEIQRTIMALEELQIAYQNAFDEGSVANWEEFLDSSAMNSELEDIYNSFNVTKEDIEETLGIKIPEFELKANTEELDKELDNLVEGRTISYDANVDGAETKVTALMNENGELTYTAIIDDVETTLAEIKNEDGTITYTADVQKVKDELEKAGKGGNVDLTNRPTVSSSNMKNAGYTDFNEGDYATLYTHTFSNEDETVAVNFTPILPDGTVMEKGAFERYCEDVIAGAEDTKGLQIGAEFVGEDAIEQAEEQAEYIHDLSANLPTKHLFFNDVDQMSLEKIKSEMKELASGSTIDFFAPDLDGISRKIQAIKEEDGSITFKAQIDGEPTEVDLNKEGRIQYKYTSSGAESVKSEAEGVQKSIFGVPKNRKIKFSQSGAEAVTKNAKNLKTAVDNVPKKPKLNFVATGLQTLLTKLDKLKTKLKEVAGKKPVKSNGTFASGTAHAHGSAYANGVRNDIPIDAFSNDRYKTKNSEVALTGELGQELVVHGNRWWTVGDNGAEFSAIPSGSIVFNHEQTKQLLRNGSINSRGKAYLSGTAYESGGYLPSGSSGGSSSGSSSNKSSSSSKSKKKSSSSSDAEKFDWIERAIKKIERAIDNLDKTVSATWKKWTDRNAALTDEISKINEEIELQEKAYKRYLEEANKVKFTSKQKKYRDKVMNGEIDIESIKSDKLREKIQEYQEWYIKCHVA